MGDNNTTNCLSVVCLLQVHTNLTSQHKIYVLLQSSQWKPHTPHISWSNHIVWECQRLKQNYILTNRASFPVQHWTPIMFYQHISCKRACVFKTIASNAILTGSSFNFPLYDFIICEHYDLHSCASYLLYSCLAMFDAFSTPSSLQKVNSPIHCKQ